MASLEERLDQLDDLPAIPAAVARLVSLLGDEDVDGGQIEEAVVQDQALSVAVLRMANSALFRGREVANSVREAILRLGTRNLLKVVLAHRTSDLMGRAGRGYGLDPTAARRGALAGAIAAEVLAKNLGIDDTAVPFTAALVRDCGKLAMDALIGIDPLLADMGVRPGTTDQLEFERETYGFDHTEAGVALARRWDLPDPIPAAIEHHHSPPSDAHDVVLDIVHVADAVSAHLGFGVGHDGLRYWLDPDALQRLRLNRDRYFDCLAQVSLTLPDFDPELDTEPETAS